jgi:hypothetical protein
MRSSPTCCPRTSSRRFASSSQTDIQSPWWATA